ncbi:MAG: hypothetical protein RLZZ385_416 [Pseudomonadota bacterium]
MLRLTSLAILFTLVSTSAAADTTTLRDNPSSKEETVGLLGGMAVGGAVGGPPGLIAGAAIGALLGDGLLAKRRVSHLQASLQATHRELALLQEETRTLRLAGQSSGAAVRGLPVLAETGMDRVCCDNTVVSLYFRNDSSAVEPQDHELLSSFANLTRQMPDPAIEITGYADRNGDAEYNLELSRQRSLAVRDALARLGVDNIRVTTIAYGEARPLHAQQSPANDFFDRRVILRLRDASQLMVTRNAN